MVFGKIFMPCFGLLRALQEDIFYPQILIPAAYILIVSARHDGQFDTHLHSQLYGIAILDVDGANGVTLTVHGYSGTREHSVYIKDYGFDGF